MPHTDLPRARPSRRGFLRGSAAVLALVAAGPLRAQTGPAAFSFDMLIADARAAAAQDFTPPARLNDLVAGLDYDDYQRIQFRRDSAYWAGDGGRWQLQAFHPGWLFDAPVNLFDVTDGTQVPISFSTADFEYFDDLAARFANDTPLPGIAGFRLNGPLNRPDRFDEIVAFLGASYFRALGRDNRYGISARGLALNTAGPLPEEFPKFTAFYVARTPGDTVTVHARLDSPSVTGAYRFVIRPGAVTEMDVTAHLFFRADVQELGIAPLTSMFLFSGVNRSDFDDYRPRVHDSDGLQILRRDGDVIWRPLNNPARLAGSYFAQDTPVSFGLHQRNRDFGAYLDANARYDLRPSLDVVPQGDWGPGHVRLVEIPTDAEVNDNIVAYFIPDGPVTAGAARSYSYTLRWGDLPVPTDLARVTDFRAGAAGVGGAVMVADTRKFVIDFSGGALGRLDDAARADIIPVITVNNADVLVSTLEHVQDAGVWRLVIDLHVTADGIAAGTVELTAHLAGYNRKLTEICAYQWKVTDV